MTVTEPRVSLLGITVDGSPSDVVLDLTSGMDPIVYLGVIALHCRGDADMLQAVSDAFAHAARIQQNRAYLNSLPEVA